MQFDYRQHGYIWQKLRDWDKVSDCQIFYRVVERKASIEIQLYFMLDGREWRTDYEANLDGYSTPYIYNWTTADIDKMLGHIIQLTESEMERLQLE